MGFSHLPICRNSLTCRRFEPLRAIRMLVFKHRATSNRESLRTVYFAIQRPQKPTVLSRQMQNGRKVLPTTWRYGNPQSGRHRSVMCASSQTCELRHV